MRIASRVLIAVAAVALLSVPAMADTFTFTFTNATGNVSGTVSGIIILPTTGGSYFGKGTVELTSYPSVFDTWLGTGPVVASNWNYPYANYFQETNGNLSWGYFDATEDPYSNPPFALLVGLTELYFDTYPGDPPYSLLDHYDQPTAAHPGGVITYVENKTAPSFANAVPEPATLTLFGGGLLALAGRLRRKLQK